MQPPKLDDEHPSGVAILREAKDAADGRNNALKPPWWRFWAKPPSSEDDVADER